MEVIALDEQHVDQGAAQGGQLRGVVLDDHPRRGWKRARGLRPTVDPDRAHPATPRRS